MPVLNEAQGLHATLSGLSLTDREELIIVDGGSTDATLQIAREFTSLIFSSEKGRARQMNFGAEKAAGDVFLFLHADCSLPEKGFDIVRRTVRDSAVAAGAFNIRIDHPGLSFRVIESAANLRSRVTGIAYGDQGIFMRRETFRSMGGFALIPLMEDIEIGRRLRKIGKIAFLGHPIRVSPRRWLKEGLVYTTLRDWGIALSYTLLRRPPDELARYYKDVR